MTELLLAAALGAPPGEWKFVDEPAHNGRSMTTFRTVELANTPSNKLGILRTVIKNENFIHTYKGQA